MVFFRYRNGLVLLSGWISQAMSSASAHAGASERVLGQKRRLRVRFVQIFDDGERLDQDVTRRCDQNRHAHLRIDCAKFGPLVVPAILHKVNGLRFVADAFEVERDTYPVCGRGSEIRIKLHIFPMPRASLSASATSCAVRSVICCKARWNASRSLGVKISVSLRENSSACGASSS
jgi:hypothetical protein